jgi:hypothetical protein
MNLLGLQGVELIGVTAEAYSLTYNASTDAEPGDMANLDGTEDIRSILNAIAEAFQCIYYVDAKDELTFKRLSVGGEPVLTISKNDYFALKTGDNVAIEAICHTTELGDNVSTIVKGLEGGVTQYVRENPFWSNRTDIDTILENAFAAVDGLSINQFTCEDWIGNYLLEIGDKVAFETEDGGYIYTYILNDTIAFDGTLSEASQWAYEANEGETFSNPISLGEKLNQTYAKVDKANQKITQVVSDVDSQGNRLTVVEQTADGFSATVEKVEEISAQIGGINEEIAGVKKETSDFKLEADNALLSFKKEIEENGVTKVAIDTNFKFDENGLTLSKSNIEVSTNVNANGLAIYQGEIQAIENKETGEKTITNEPVMVVNSDGVNAENLHATTWLIIGNNSRFEDWGDRTACFWIGG